MQFCRPISCPFLDQEGVILVIFEPKIGGGGGGGERGVARQKENV